MSVLCAVFEHKTFLNEYRFVAIPNVGDWVVLECDSLGLNRLGIPKSVGF
jgi:hypothetical protein